MRCQAASQYNIEMPTARQQWQSISATTPTCKWPRRHSQLTNTSTYNDNRRWQPARNIIQSNMMSHSMPPTQRPHHSNTQRHNVREPKQQRHTDPKIAMNREPTQIITQRKLKTETGRALMGPCHIKRAWTWHRVGPGDTM